MGFDPLDWTRLECEGMPIYVQPDDPQWFVPNRRGDEILQALQAGQPAPDSPDGRLFLARLPASLGAAYPGRGELLSLTGLRELWFHLTDRCNMACRHCMFCSGPDAGVQLPAARLLDVAREARDLGVRVFVLTGGEPFVHPDIVPVIDGLLALEGHVVVLTNATRVRTAADAAGWPRDRLHFQVSVDGRAPQHDALRGAGAYDRMLAELEGLRGAGYPFSLAMTVTRPNVADMPAVVDLAATTGAANVHYLWVLGRGRAQGDDRPSAAELFDGLRAAADRAAGAGVAIDNLDVLRTQVFPPPGTRHDGSTAGWESLAVGPDGRLYPTAALVGLPEVATDLTDGLARAWRSGPVLERMRQQTVRDLPHPLRYLLGGGDPDHSYLAGGTFLGADPYLELYERTVLWLIARRAAAEPDDGPAALRLKMGDVLESCGPHGAVALTHPNCLLALAETDGRSAVKSYYRAAVADPRRDILNPVRYDEALLAHVPVESRVRSYGCGSPVLDAGLRAGERVLDLGSGSGVECFIAARLVGAGGMVTGVDMLEPMLDLARRGVPGVAANLGYENVAFRRGYLESLPLADESVDVVLSNCVINLSADKRRTFAEAFRVLRPGGRLVVADVVTDTDPDPAIRNDEILRGECIAGALTRRDLFGLLAETGFRALRLIRQFPYRQVNGHPFHSLTYTAVKPAPAQDARAVYPGPFAAVLTHEGQLIPAGVTASVPGAYLADAGGALWEVAPDDTLAHLDMGGNAGCCSAVGAPAAGWADGPSAAGGGCCGNGPSSSVAMTAASTERQPIAAGAGQAAPDFGERHTADCMVCGQPLVYTATEQAAACAFCRQPAMTGTLCAAGHYVCDHCHGAEMAAVLERICLTTSETDMIALLGAIRRHPRLPLHGPEHHVMIPGIILATYRNLGGDVSAARLRTAMRRGAQIPGGYCAFAGTCGAAAGVGIAFAVLREGTPVKAEERRMAMTVTGAVLERLTRFSAARCCQRDSWLALRAAAELSAHYLPRRLRAEAPLVCEQMALNRECLGAECPLAPGGGPSSMADAD